MTLRSRLVRPSFVLAAVAASTLMSACAPLLVGGAVMGTSLMVTDRRTSGTQLEDQSIELKAMTRTREAVGERGHVNATSYNRTLLLTGEVAADTDKVAVEQAVAKIEGVRTVVNELVVAGSSSLAARSNDAILTSKVKASFIDADARRRKRGALNTKAIFDRARSKNLAEASSQNAWPLQQDLQCAGELSFSQLTQVRLSEPP